MTLIKLLILMKWNVERGSMKKLLGIAVLGLFLTAAETFNQLRPNASLIKINQIKSDKNEIV